MQDGKLFDRRTFCQMSSLLYSCWVSGCSETAASKQSESEKTGIHGECVVENRQAGSTDGVIHREDALLVWVRFPLDKVTARFADPTNLQSEDKWYVWCIPEPIPGNGKLNDQHMASLCIMNRYLPEGLQIGGDTLFVGGLDGSMFPPTCPSEFRDSGERQRIWFGPMKAPSTIGTFKCAVQVHPGSTLHFGSAGGSIGRGILVAEKQIEVK